MCSNQKTYTKYVSDMLLQAVGGIKKAGIALFASRLLAFEDKDGNVIVSIDSLCDLFCCSPNTIRSYAKTLSMLDIWHMKTFVGKGNKSQWTKGSNFESYMGTQKVQTLSSKGSNFEGNNKDNNKDCLTRTRVRETKQTKNKVMDNNFGQFWTSFFSGSYAQYEHTQASYKDRAMAVWTHMSESSRNSCLRDIRAGKRYDRTEYILYYLQRYKEPLPIYYNGDANLTQEFVASACVLRYNGVIVYCAPENKDRCVAAGAEFIRVNNHQID